MRNIKIIDFTKDSPEICKDLCNSLMEHQAMMGKKYKKILASMNYDNRLALTFEKNKEKLLLVAMDNDKPIGYIFSIVENISEKSKEYKPPWTETMEKEDREGEGFYSKSMKVPMMIGDINNLFLLPEYRGEKIAEKLMNQSLDWINSYKDVEKIFVMVSNGNNVGTFYERFGFKFDHDVFGGFIKAYSMNSKDSLQ